MGLTACGGTAPGGPARANPPPSAGASAMLVVHIVVPQAGSRGARRPGYISAATRSAVLSVGPAGGAVSTTATIACTSVCSETLGAPAGSDTISVALYDGSAGNGNVLSTGSLTTSVVQNQDNPVNITFNPVVGSVGIGFGSTSVTTGTPSSTGVTITLRDADGNSIVGPGSPLDSHGNPLTVTASTSQSGGVNASVTVTPSTYTLLGALSGTLTYTGNSLNSASVSVTTSDPSITVPAPTNLTVNPVSSSVEYPLSVPASEPYIITTGSDNNLWVTENNRDAIARVTTAGAITEFTAGITAGSQLVGIAAGPDGNFWACEWGTDKIARITTNGVVNEYNVAGGSTPFLIVAGPDGAMWFTEPSNGVNGALARITTNGTLNEYPLAFTSRPKAIVVGPDGNFWITEFAGGVVARVTPGLVLTEFGGALFNGGDIANGPDGKIWFTELTPTNKIGKITTAGVWTQYVTPGTNPVGLVTGIDGNMWFTDFTQSLIEKSTTAGVITQYPLTPGTGPSQITVGPDGNLWATEYTAGKIARLIF
jgi:virginiamycin B lyase